MTEGIQDRRRGALWVAFVLALGAVLCNAAFFVSFPGQKALEWPSLLFPAAALAALVVGMVRVFRQPSGGRTASSILAVVTALVAGLAIVGFFHACDLPASHGAPTVGQKVPDFTLPDTSGQPVSLAQLLAPAARGAAPKSVLLVFYRGYW